MGNRAVIIEFGKQEGIYLHWNGGRDSVEPMLYYAKHFLTMEGSYFTSNIKKVEFIATCLGLDPHHSEDYAKLDCDNYDNGVYVIDKDYKIIERLFKRYEEQTHYNFNEFLLFIDENMPKRFQKGEAFINKYLASEEVEKELIYTKDASEKVILFDDLNKVLQVGDIIYYQGEFKEIIGKNDEEKLIVNGSDVSKSVFFNYTENYEENSPYKYDAVKDFEKIRKNPNSYLHYTYVTNHRGEAVKVLQDDNFRIVNKEKLYKITKEKLDNIINGN